METEDDDEEEEQNESEHEHSSDSSEDEDEEQTQSTSYPPASELERISSSELSEEGQADNNGNNGECNGYECNECPYS